MAKPKRRVAFALLVVFCTLLVAEVTMRIVFSVQGYTVGSLAPNWFPQTTDGTLPILEKSYFTDSHAIFRANAEFWEKEGVGINSHGFLGSEWLPDTSKTKLLLIGDSFLWGAGASPLSNSFASKLAKNTDYQVFNTGIPGADPAQYELLAQQYMPMLKPECIVVFVYLGNDLMAEKRKPMPNLSLYFPSNQGWFPGYYHGQYFDSLAASYSYYLAKYRPRQGFASLACRTAIGTALYSLPLRFEEIRERRLQMQSGITNQHLKAIVSDAKEINAKVLIVPIAYSGTDFISVAGKKVQDDLLVKYHNAFNGLEGIIVMPPMLPEHYHQLPDGHFNNKGHAVMAHFLIGAIERIMGTQP